MFIVLDSEEEDRSGAECRERLYITYLPRAFLWNLSKWLTLWFGRSHVYLFIVYLAKLSDTQFYSVEWLVNS